MSVTLTDPILIAQLMTGAAVELKDASGLVLGVFVPDGLGKPPAGMKSPFSDEEMAARRKESKTSRPLADIIRDLEAPAMKYQVTWDETAEAELAAIWLATDDQTAVTRATAWLDQNLALKPLELGESRSSSVQRWAYWPPLWIEFEVIEDDKRVVVQAVFTQT